jgi:ribulose-5-phosphate 4-epimerase/fuculose-1-phosphate aldolase
LTVGRTAAEAFVGMYVLEAACRIQVMAQFGGADLILIGEPILKGVSAQLDQVTKGLGAELAWPALLRKLDRIDPGYKE